MSALYTKGRRFEPHRRRFFTPTVVLLSFNKPETVLWTIEKILLLLSVQRVPTGPFYLVKQPQEKWACYFHDDALPLSFQLQVTEVIL